MRDDAAVAALIQDVVAKHGKLDIALANAGIATVTSVSDMDFDTWRSVLAVNLDGVFSTVRHAARAMAASGGGSIITMASITGSAGSPLLARTTRRRKAGVISLTKTAAIEFRGRRGAGQCDLPLASSAPTWCSTGRADFEKGLGLDDFGAVINQAQGRLGEVGDVAPLAAFLASERSRFW